MPSRRAVYAYELVNRRGTRLTAITLGATITSLLVADRTGALDDVVLGMDDVEGYLTRSPYFGAVVGRYANRIARGRFHLDDRAYTLATNDGTNHLHGGAIGFDKQLYAARSMTTPHGVAVRFSLTSPDGDEGYPGEVRFSVRYLLTHDDRIVIDFQATSSKATPFNPSQHTYWNLAGAHAADILDHVLLVHADAFTPVDPTLIPTGDVAPLEATPFDFRRATAIGARIAAPDPQLQIGGGYDHNFVLRQTAGSADPAHAATLHDPVTGRQLDVFTTEPGMQLYSGNHLGPALAGRGGRHYGQHAGLCLETQHFPDSPNQPHFPDVILRPATPFRSRTIWAFSAR